MRDVGRLPPFLRVIGFFGRLLPLASVVMFLALLVVFILGGAVVRQEFANDPRLLVIALNLTLLGSACNFAIKDYRTRLRQPNQEQVLRAAFPLDAWPGQARATMVLAAPLSAISLAAIMSPTEYVAVAAVYLITIIGAVALATAFARLEARG